ncbi:RidA family protein [Alphaproteobacteria bacterium KMM 3653]|uniref:RidA family protein n=1 Tax=Harenicola maris TaxID=2841044 RepID=A0AAP2CNV9_9RHOB|nr:RidA family protein [Harenicola maris]
MHKALTPTALPAPFARYSHGVEVSGPARWVWCSGQLGMDAQGHIPEDAGQQAAICFRNAAAILSSAGMGMADVVRVNAFVTDRAYMAPYMEARDACFDGVPPASTLMIVGGFTRPEFKVEVEIVAAQGVTP